VSRWGRQSGAKVIPETLLALTFISRFIRIGSGIRSILYLIWALAVLDSRRAQMPLNSPLTQTPYGALTDAANIETAVGPGIRHLERFAIPRFASLSARNAAFAGVTPEVGQVIYVLSQGHLGYQVWNGTEWEEFGEYTRSRELVVRKENDQSFNSTGVMSNVQQLSFPVKSDATYKFQVTILATQVGAPGDTRGNLATNFTFPGSGSRCSAGGVGPSQQSTSLTNAGVNVGNSTQRSSGDLLRTWGVYVGSTSHITIKGILRMSSSANGTFQTQVRKIDVNDSKPVSVVRDSCIEWQRIT
jgi:hypothetical protein